MVVITTRLPTHVGGWSSTVLLHGLVLSGLLLSVNHSLLVLASLILKPHPDDTWVETRDLHQVFLEKSVWPWISTVYGT